MEEIIFEPLMRFPITKNISGKIFFTGDSMLIGFSYYDLLYWRIFQIHLLIIQIQIYSKFEE